MNAAFSRFVSRPRKSKSNVQSLKSPLPLGETDLRMGSSCEMTGTLRSRVDSEGLEKSPMRSLVQLRCQLRQWLGHQARLVPAEWRAEF